MNSLTIKCLIKKMHRKSRERFHLVHFEKIRNSCKHFGMKNSFIGIEI